MNIATGLPWLLTATVLLSAPSTVSAQALSPEEIENIDAIFEPLVGDDTPGAAIAIVRGGETAFSKGYGLAHLEHDVPIGAHTRFHLISGSKQFTAYAICKLQEQGLLSLDDEIHEHLPDFPDLGAPITIRHLLHHTSGLRQANILQRYTEAPGHGVLSQSRVLELLYQQRELNFEPGSAFRYSDSGYILLAEIVERISGEPFPDWMAEHVFGPLGMEDSAIVDSYSSIIPNRAQPYQRSRDGFTRTSAALWEFYGGTGVHSNTRDLARWLSFLQSPPPDAAALVEQLHQTGVLNDGEQIPWALGLVVDEAPPGVRRVWHTGDTRGYRIWIGRYPDHDLGIVVLSNLNELPQVHVAQSIAGVVIPEAAWPEEDWVEPTTVELNHEQLDAVAGRYLMEADPLYRAESGWHFWRRDDQLMLYPEGHPSTPLLATSDSTFAFPGAPVTLNFHRNGSGIFDRVVLRDPDQERAGVRYADIGFRPARELLEEYLGVYHSPELLVDYEIRLGEKELVLHHLEPDAGRRRAPASLQPLTSDFFRARNFHFNELRFDRDADGRVNGFRVTDQFRRIVNLKFERRNGPAD